MKTAEDLAKAFIAEQSDGEWGEKIEAEDARNLATLIRRIISEAHDEGMELAAQVAEQMTRAPAQRNSKDVWVEDIGKRISTSIRSLIPSPARDSLASQA